MQFSVPKSLANNVFSIDTFLGYDFTNSPTNVDSRRASDGKNMIRDVPGKVRKCMGYERVSYFQGEQINGFHTLRGKTSLIHAGTKLYQGATALYSACGNSRSKSWQLGNYTYIADGAKLLKYDGTTVVSAGDGAYIPTVTIAKKPAGGGTSYEGLNLIQPGFIEMFSGVASTTAYSLSFSPLDSTAVKAWVLNSSGTWVEKTETTDFTVNRTTGVVTFTTAPGASPVTGEDNVKIQAYRTVTGYADKVNKCRYGILYGINGEADRLFLSGNTDYPNYDWFSQRLDGTYWSDVNYCTVGSAASAIMGYSIVNGYLAAHKDEMDPDRTVVLRSGELNSDSKPTFPVKNTLQGEGVIAPYSIAYLETEPLFMTKSGIYAITPQDVTGERYSSRRSYYLNGKLLEEADPEESFGFSYNDMYWLCLNGVAYILDGLQSSRTKNDPYSTRQYEGYYRTNIPARVMWSEDGVLFFGTANGEVMRFYTDKNDVSSYSDGKINGDSSSVGTPIESVWETPDLSGNLFYKKKSYRYLAVRLASAITTSIVVYGQRKGIWNTLWEDDKSARYWTFGYVNYLKISFSADQTPRSLGRKIRIKNVDKARFRFVNSQLDEPFGLFDLAVEYRESGNYKG